MKNYLFDLFTSVKEKFDISDDTEINFDIPKIESHGDYSTNIAMLLAKKLKKNPRDLAHEIIYSLEHDLAVISKVEVAGPGFINFFFNPDYISRSVKEILEKGAKFGKTETNLGKKALVEFVSANPTGPLTVGHGRNAVSGDTMANLLEATGYKVDREYYFNNAGRQMRVLGNSVRLRYLELLGEQVEFPEDHYQGQYIIDIAKGLLEKNGDTLKNEDAEGIFKDEAEKVIFEDIKKTLGRLGIKHETFFNENSLYEEGKIESLLNTFKERGLSYEKDGAVWLKLSDLGNEKDKVIVKNSGEPTYRLPDIAYHATKFDRGYDFIVDLFGSDHTATYPDVLAALSELGYDTEKVKVMIHQFVTIIKEGKAVKMSTRKANYITLDELIDWVGSDVVRYFFNMRAVSTHLNFDLDLAVKHSEENPVFYLQYAHARICSIIRMTTEQGLSASSENLTLLSTEEEQKLIKKLLFFPDAVENAARVLDAVVLCAYLEELAAAFHKFYTVCRILGSEERLASARLALVNAVKLVLANGLALLGVSAPERM
ncbi:MAG: arginine--tRNA ligase [Ignavibacteriales bacterium]|nr:MAG: arginine--tRNA ligase [Ignavibacteriaceae bacterium]MBW7872157.1 arginine--tRNA ligase [Ignavibacteria bacterium]MCZ2142259.1 arginine--tRNA ligase [Ignavibacteriales bacterium]OQY78805.1 MAG: arginine--tRNA ligase [Ignavibacteriales bacterium UTCHB3]MBV6445698.1 Arginine--tRNA ligase [Ignavibacteriaceae bacterium]